ncbi:MAG: hypothetical protein FD122_3871, partial [Stygiobacter sp.]
SISRRDSGSIRTHLLLFFETNLVRERTHTCAKEHLFQSNLFEERPHACTLACTHGAHARLHALLDAAIRLGGDAHLYEPALEQAIRVGAHARLHAQLLVSVTLTLFIFFNSSYILLLLGLSSSYFHFTEESTLKERINLLF